MPLERSAALCKGCISLSNGEAFGVALRAGFIAFPRDNRDDRDDLGRPPQKSSRSSQSSRRIVNQ